MNRTSAQTGLSPRDSDRLASLRAYLAATADSDRYSSRLSDEDLEFLRGLQPLPYLGGGHTGPDGRTFPWGPIVATHHIGDISVVEYLRDCSNLTPLTARVEHGLTFYSAYVNNRSISRSASTLDSALVAAIAYKRRGPNDHSAHAFDLMTLGVLPSTT